jgi:hypothetical protein
LGSIYIISIFGVIFWLKNGLKQVKMAAILNFRGQIMKLTTEMDSMGVK